TPSGKAVARSVGRGHILSSKTGKRKRQLRGDTILTGAMALKICEGLAPSR
ncbi:MAG TPA: bL35 family ribosomal protein, partial [Planctomycetaceae bacterium]|nr:bL35 family ribosomal protein [Planctomycetaceae bacterium]